MNTVFVSFDKEQSVECSLYFYLAKEGNVSQDFCYDMDVTSVRRLVDFLP